MERRAIVVGASIAGLLAARALLERFGQVLVLDRDELAGPEHARKAVPQGNHIHVIWSGGAAAMLRDQRAPGALNDAGRRRCLGSGR